MLACAVVETRGLEQESVIGIQQDGELFNRGQVARQVGVGQYEGEDANCQNDRKNEAETQPCGADA
jgi:hypothetical protein